MSATFLVKYFQCKISSNLRSLQHDRLRARALLCRTSIQYLPAWWRMHERNQIVTKQADSRVTMSLLRFVSEQIYMQYLCVWPALGRPIIWCPHEPMRFNCGNSMIGGLTRVAVVETCVCIFMPIHLRNTDSNTSKSTWPRWIGSSVDCQLCTWAWIVSRMDILSKAHKGIPVQKIEPK